MSSAFNGTEQSDLIVAIRDRLTDYNTGFTPGEINNPSSSQIHVWGMQGHDTIELGFNAVDRFTKGHHARGDDKFFSGGNFEDTFVFRDLDQITSGATVVGRLEDYDASRDTIRIGDTEIDPKAGSGTVNGYDWKIVNWDVDPSDGATQTQQWLVIDTNDGHLFYALEGARVTLDLSGGADGGNQEDHFVSNESLLPSNFDSLEAVAFIDRKNVVPNGYSAEEGGLTINDYDTTPDDVAKAINGSAFGDLIAGGLNDDLVFAGDGDDRVWGGTGNDEIDGGNGDDSLNGGHGSDTVSGGQGNDSLTGQGGNDFLRGGEGSDTLIGGVDNDTLRGEQGDDYLKGGNGNDVVAAGGGNDTIIGENGNDTLLGRQGSDEINGGRGNDFIVGNQNDDTLLGGLGNDTLRGGSSDDVIRAGGGNDVIVGGKGEDILTGRKGDDIIFGNSGSDVLTGGRGDDVLSGGPGTDTFIFSANHGTDTITDFLDDEIIFLKAKESSLSVQADVATGDTTLSFGETSVVIEGYLLDIDDIVVTEVDNGLSLSW